jgi:hypothetical protein
MTLIALRGALALSGGCLWCAAGAAAATIATITERATNETFRELRGAQAKEQSAVAVESARKADEMRQKSREKKE